MYDVSKIDSIFVINLKKYMQQNNLQQNQLAEKINTSSATVSLWLSGERFPRMDKIEKMCKLFHCSKSDLLEDNSKKKNKIPILGRVVAGYPNYALEEVIGYIEYDGDTDGLFSLEIKGDSMIPLINPKDTIICRQQSVVENGDIAIVLVNGNDATCKKIKRSKDGIQLIPFNNVYDVLYYTNKEIEELPVRIIGKVIELRREF